VNVLESALPEVKVLESPVWSDERGFFTESFRSSDFAHAGLPATWAQDGHSRSIRGVLRGLHYQVGNAQGKLVRVAQGVIFDVAVDVRRSSPTFGRWFGIVLQGGDGRQLWIPAGYAHGFLVLSDTADVLYKFNTEFDAHGSRSLAWNDPTIAIDWPLEGRSPRLSSRDSQAPLIEDAECYP
jgi:dTDP-4-dehydrorhamnose 3,5-epimerase